MAWKEVIPYREQNGHAICSCRVTVYTPSGKSMGVLIYVAEHKGGEYKPVSYKGRTYYTSLPKAITAYNALYPADAFYLLSNRNDLTGIAEEYERIRAEEWAREDAERKRKGNHEHES